MYALLYISNTVINENGTENFNNNLYPRDFRNSLTINGLPWHTLELQIGAPVMLLRIFNVEAGLCKGPTLTALTISNWRRTEYVGPNLVFCCSSAPRTPLTAGMTRQTGIIKWLWAFWLLDSLKLNSGNCYRSENYNWCISPRQYNIHTKYKSCTMRDNTSVQIKPHTISE